MQLWTIVAVRGSSPLPHHKVVNDVLGGTMNTVYNEAKAVPDS